MLYRNFCVEHDNKGFNHDDAAEFLALNGLASSQGAIGHVALARSRRPDRSRDPLYNQHKMYSEMYRMLGWYEPNTCQTQFKMTEYGEYIFESRGDEEKRLFALNTLHIVSPNQLTEVKGQNVLRPFPMILRLALRLNGYICRDEIILGVLACSNDREEGIIDKVAQKIKSIRTKGKNALDQEIQYLNQINGYSTPATSQNYTRFPIAAMKWNGWADGVSVKNIYPNNTMTFLKLTDIGIELAKNLENSIDIRYEDISTFSVKEQASFVVWSNLHQLERIGYDLSHYLKVKENMKENAVKIFSKYNIDDNTNLLFFGYQEASRSLLRYGDELIENI
jgi:hypothetical protein